MLDYRGKKQFIEINHSKKAQNTGLLGHRAVYRNQSFKKSPKHGIKINSPQSFIQNNCKMLDYRGKKQFIEINHSKKA
jgi:hypothetical protein